MKIGSLCSGYGGLDLATCAVFGGDVIWHCENDPDAGRILAHRWPGVPNHGDLKSVDWCAVEPVDLLTAGYPCQPFSVAGKRKGEDDERHLWPDVARAIRDLRPRLVVLENVPGHLVRGFPAVVGELASIGYDARWTCVRASDVGAPHRRNRLFVIASDTSCDRGADKPRRDREVEFLAVDRAGVGDAGRRPAARGERVGEPAGIVASAVADTDSQEWIRPGKPGHGMGGQDWPAARRDGAPVLSDTDGASRRPVEPRRIASRPAAGTGPEASRRAGRGGDSPAPDADGHAVREQPVTEPGRDGESVAGQLGADAAADAEGDRRHEGRPKSAGFVGGSDAAVGSPIDWGAYTAAIRRWEYILGRAAPVPTERGPRGGRRLSPAFVEWMMGLSAGWVTDPAIGIGRNAQLRALGNGVVPQQAVTAELMLLCAEAMAA